MSKTDQPGHYTDNGTRKFQANGSVAWSRVFRAAAGKGGREGEGIRAALAYAVGHEEAFLAWANKHEATAALGREPKAPKAPKAAPKAAGKGPKAPKAARKGPKAPKAAGKAPPAPAPAQAAA